MSPQPYIRIGAAGDAVAVGKGASGPGPDTASAAESAAWALASAPSG